MPSFPPHTKIQRANQTFTVHICKDTNMDAQALLHIQTYTHAHSFSPYSYPHLHKYAHTAYSYTQTRPFILTHTY